MRIGDTAAAIGLAEREDQDAAIVAFIDGKPVNRTLRECQDRDIESVDTDLYLASGLFRRGSIQPREGRKRDNLTRVLWLPLDFDLIDWFGFTEPGPMRDRQLTELRNMEQEDLDAEVAALQADVETAMAQAGLPIHRLDYTGYGLCAYTYAADGESVSDWTSLYPDAVRQINTIAGRELADRQVSDAGTRITRLPGSRNFKGRHPRQTRTLIRRPGAATHDELRERIGAHVPHTVHPVSLPTARPLPDEQVQNVITTLQPTWGAGFRHWIAFATAGMLAKAGLPEAQTETIVRALARDDEQLEDRLTAVRTTYKNLAQGRDVAGYTHLRRILPSHTVSYLDAQLPQNSRGSITVGARPQEPEPTTYTEPPDEAFGEWLRIYAEIMLPTTEAPLGYHLAVGLTIAGAVMGKGPSVYDGGNLVHANLYTLLVGESATSKKDTSAKRGTFLTGLPMPASGPTLIPSPLRIIRNVASAPALVQMLAAHPMTLLYQSEYSVLSHEGTREATKDLFPKIMEAWDCPNRLENNVKAVGTGEAPVAEHPYFSVLTTTQPQTMAALSSKGDMHTGWLNRFLIVPGEGRGAMPTPQRIDQDAARNLWHWLLEAKTAARGERTWSHEAANRWREWYTAQYDRRPGEGDDERAMRGRHGTLAWKIALIHAVLDHSPVIALDHLNAGIATIEWAWGNLRLLIPEWGTNLDALIETRIRKVLQQAHPLPRVAVRKRCEDRRWSGVDFHRVWESMHRNEELIAHPTDGWDLAEA